MPSFHANLDQIALANRTPSMATNSRVGLSAFPSSSIGLARPAAGYLVFGVALLSVYLDPVHSSAPRPPHAARIRNPR